MIFKSLLPDVEMPNVDIATFVFEQGKKEFGSLPIPDNFALYDEVTGQSMTIWQLEGASTRFASGLVNRLGFQTDDTLLLFSTNSANYVTTFLGTLMAGGIVTFSNPAYTPRELCHQINDSKPKFIATTTEAFRTTKEAIALSTQDIPDERIIIIDHNRPTIGNTIPIKKLYSNLAFKRFTIGPNDDADKKVAFLPYSSGTTGLSKGVILSHKNIVSNIIQTIVFDKLNGWHTDKSIVHRYLAVLPWYHIYGLTICLLTGLSDGVGVVSLPKFEMKKFLETVQKHRITFGHLVPPILINLVNDPLVDKYDISSLRHATTAAAPIGKELMLQLKQKFTNMRIIKIYGVTESSPTISAAPNGTPNIESSGILTCNQEAMVIDDDGKELAAGEVGELLFRGPNIMKGYLNNPEATKNTIDKNGFLHTGDIGYVDAEGHLYIVDRKKELIKYKGFQVPPAELEALLLGHPDVADCAVIGIYDDKQATELPKAFITLKSQHLNKSSKEKAEVAKGVQKWVQDNVVSYKRLRGGVEVLQVIPKSNAGKILRRVLRDMEKQKTLNPSSKL